jgi:hypothetical protein
MVNEQLKVNTIGADIPSNEIENRSTSFGRTTFKKDVFSVDSVNASMTISSHKLCVELIGSSVRIGSRNAGITLRYFWWSSQLSQQG